LLDYSTSADPLLDYSTSADPLLDFGEGGYEKERGRVGNGGKEGEEKGEWGKGGGGERWGWVSGKEIGRREGKGKKGRGIEGGKRCVFVQWIH